MISGLTRYFFLLFWVTSVEATHAQKEIIISESLAAFSEKLPVKMGTQWMGKIWNFKFGEYGVESSKMGWNVTTTRSNLFNTKTESSSTQKFSFVLKHKTNGSALVNAANNISTKALQEMQISSHFYVGSNELLHASVNFSAFISMVGDTTESWALYMDETLDKTLGNKYEAILTNGERTIMIFQATSNKNGTDTRAIPAIGYEFVETEKSIGAVQYYGGGNFGANKNIIWLSNDLDAKNKLILASAMTALLQIKATSLSGG